MMINVTSWSVSSNIYNIHTHYAIKKNSQCIATSYNICTHSWGIAQVSLCTYDYQIPWMLIQEL